MYLNLDISCFTYMYTGQKYSYWQMYFVKIFHFNPYTIIWMLWLSELWLHCVYIHVCVYITGVACWLDFRESLGFGITLPNLQKFYFHLIDTVLTFILTLSMKAQELLVRRQWPYMCKCPRNWKLLAACLLSAHWDFFNKKYNFYIFFFSYILGFMMHSMFFDSKICMFFFKPLAWLQIFFLQGVKI